MQVEVKKIIRQLGITTIFVTHDQEEALTMSDLVAVMNAGQIVQSGVPTEIYDSPKDPFVADFLGGGNFIPVEGVGGTPGGMVPRPGDIVFEGPSGLELQT